MNNKKKHKKIMKIKKKTIHHKKYLPRNISNSKRTIGKAI